MNNAINLSFTNEKIVELSQKQNSVEIRGITGNGVCTLSKTVVDRLINTQPALDLRVTVINLHSPDTCDDLFEQGSKRVPDILQAGDPLDFAQIKETLKFEIQHGNKTQLFVIYGSSEDSDWKPLIKLGKDWNSFFIFVNDWSVDTECNADIAVNVHLDKITKIQEINLSYAI